MMDTNIIIQVDLSNLLNSITNKNVHNGEFYLKTCKLYSTKTSEGQFIFNFFFNYDSHTGSIIYFTFE
jgi:hypothetical protein